MQSPKSCASCAPPVASVIGINAAHYAAAHFGATLEQLVHTCRTTDLRLVDVPIYDAAAYLHDPDEIAHIAIFEVA